jgi:hypothetical protein
MPELPPDAVPECLTETSRSFRHTSAEGGQPDKRYTRPVRTTLQFLDTMIARLRWRMLYTWTQPDGSVDTSRPRLR